MKEVKKAKEERIFKTNCYTCGVELKEGEYKIGPGEGDKRVFCQKDYKKNFGTKRKLIKRV